MSLLHILGIENPISFSNVLLNFSKKGKNLVAILISCHPRIVILFISPWLCSNIKPASFDKKVGQEKPYDNKKSGGVVLENVMRIIRSVNTLIGLVYTYMKLRYSNLFEYNLNRHT